jgi:hypothetical protein
MTTLQRALLTATVVAAVGTAIFEAFQASRLRSQIQNLQALHGDRIQQLQRERDDAARQLAALRDENQRLARNTAELLKLRGELTRLRKEVKAAEQGSNNSATAQKLQPLAEQAPSSAPPVETYSARTQAVVPWDMAFVTGGWKTPSGKRALVFAVPMRVEDAGQLQIQACVMELPDEAATKLGLSQFNTDAREATAAGLLSSDQYGAIVKAAEEAGGVAVLVVPPVTTVSGRQAQLQVVDKRQMPSGKEYWTGPTIDIIPTISPDGQSVQMAIAAQLNYLVQPPHE